MKKFGIALCIFVLAPLLAVHAQTTSTQQSQIQALMAQVQYLQSLLSTIDTAQGVASPVVSTTPLVSVTATPASSTCVNLARTLDLGSSGQDVTALQTFLAGDATLYPEGLITGYYGGLTVKAVQRFQSKNGIVSSGSPATTGYGAVGPKTRAALTAGCSGGTGVYNPAISTALVVSPRIGQVPLPVTATFSLNGSSCSSFSLDWGDGSAPITFDAGSGAACSKDIAHKEAKHTYRTAGAYALVLKAGQGPLSAVTQVANVPVYVGVPVPANFSLTPTSGNAPLTTSVTFPVTGSTCTSFELDWGDGTIDRIEAQTTVCSLDTGTEARSHVYANPGSYNVTLKTGHGPISGLSINERWSVRVDPPIGGAALSFLSTSGTVPFTANVALTAGNATCSSYMVDWGDGTPIQQYDAAVEASSSCTPGPRVFTHTFITPGTYNVRTRVGEGSLNALPTNTQPIVVIAPISTTQSCADTRPVCGELGTGSCQAGYVCNPTRANYSTICAMQAAGAYLINYGSCQ
jgi:PKD repeat protein